MAQTLYKINVDKTRSKNETNSDPTRLKCQKGWTPVVHPSLGNCGFDKIQDGKLPRCGMWNQPVFYCAKDTPKTQSLPTFSWSISPLISKYKVNVDKTRSKIEINSDPTRFKCQKGWIPVMRDVKDGCGVQPDATGKIPRCGIWNQPVFYCAKDTPKTQNIPVFSWKKE